MLYTCFDLMFIVALMAIIAMGVVTESPEFRVYMIISFPSGLDEAANVASFWLYT